MSRRRTPIFISSTPFLAASAAAFVLMLPLQMLIAWSLTLLWSWYIQPGWGVQHLGLGTAFGIRIAVALLVFGLRREDDDDAHPFVRLKEDYSEGVAAVGCYLAFAWLGTFFV